MTHSHGTSPVYVSIICMVDFYEVNVGKYTVRPMDPMGNSSIWINLCWCRCWCRSFCWKVSNCLLSLTLEIQDLKLEVSYGCWTKNRGKTPQIIHFKRVWNHYKPSILGYPYFWKHPYFGILCKRLSFRMFEKIQHQTEWLQCWTHFWWLLKKVPHC